MWRALLISTTVFAPQMAQAETPAHAEGLIETLVTVPIDAERTQSGVYSVKRGGTEPTKLAVLLPGYPSVVRPVVEDGAMVQSLLTGNFLIRARRHLVDHEIATLIVDCHSASGDYCSDAYQASRERYTHVTQLIATLKKSHPTIREVWLIGTSLGTVSSAFMPTHGPHDFAGAIHTATITNNRGQTTIFALVKRR